MQTTEEALSFLYSLIPKGIKLGLKNISCVLKELGDPQLKIPSIQIAGTNGKGSTSAFCESILRTAGYRVGLYTSPHLIHFNERIQIDRIPIPENEMIPLVHEIKEVVEKFNIPITFFEFSTAMAFLYFAQKKTDINVIEVGMGGRLDATSLCRGGISIITSISLDHSKYLGDSIDQIAFEKASIIKKNGTVFALNESEIVVEVIERVARDKSAEINLLGEHFRVKRTGQEPPSQFLTYSNNHVRFENLKISLLGDFQADNAALAVSACIHHADKAGKELSEQSIRTGLETTHWDGRMEVVSDRPTIILDSAHNPEAVKKMAISVKGLFSYARAVIIVGLMRDKPGNEILELLSSFGDHFILVRPRQDRSEDPERLREYLCHRQISCEVIESVHEAIRKAKQIASPDDIVCITGSIFTVGEAKQYFEENEPDFKNNIPASSGDTYHSR
jgi:dihydrofolate synthase/folylpolyglutamate synthase